MGVLIIGGASITGAITSMIVGERSQNRAVKCNQIVNFLGGNKAQVIQRLPAPPPDRDYLANVLENHYRNTTGGDPILVSVGKEQLTPEQLVSDLRNRTARGDVFFQEFMQHWDAQ